MNIKLIYKTLEHKKQTTQGINHTSLLQACGKSHKSEKMSKTTFYRHKVVFLHQNDDYQIQCPFCLTSFRVLTLFFIYLE